MPNAHIAPYLTFDGNCREALEFYHSVLGGAVEMHPFSEYYPDQKDSPHGDKIMHGMLKNDAASFMASDKAMEGEYVVGNHMSMALSGSDAGYLHKAFTGLSEGGTVTMPLEKQVWGDEFGMLTDKFGIVWMVNVSTK